MKIIFAGTPAFARVALERLLTAGFQVPLVLTQPDRLQHGQRKLGLWLAEVGASAVQPTDEAAFRNLNTPEDLGA